MAKPYLDGKPRSATPHLSYPRHVFLDLRSLQFHRESVPVASVLRLRCRRRLVLCGRNLLTAESWLPAQLPSTSSNSTPAVLCGCTNTYRWPPAPVLISFDTRRTPSLFTFSTAAARSGTRIQT